jgi:hypothetical protein
MELGIAWPTSPSVNTPKKRDSRCRARAKSGKHCRAAATAGGLCFFHANPNKASELGRIGGRSKRQSPAESADPLPTLDSATAVRNTVARLIADVYSGKLDPRVAAGLAPLLRLQLQAIGNTDLEQQLAKWEKLLAEARPLAEAELRESRSRQQAREFSATSPSPEPEEGLDDNGPRATGEPRGGRTTRGKP